MYGQTNCFVLPEGIYGAFEMINDEIFIVSERAAKNMAYQDLTKEYGQVKKILEIKGTDLLGLPLKAPLAKYEKIYALPMLSILMDKGTGIVTSVPSDAPDDYATLRDLQKKQAFREKFGIKDYHIIPFEPVPIIEIPQMGNLSAILACEEFKVASQNDKEKLKLAKDKCYTKGFYDGKMLVGKYKGKKVQEAKEQVKKDLIISQEAVSYYEPEGKVISRSGDECIVSLCDQWYISYNDENWKKQIREHVNGPNFNCYNNVVLKSIQTTVDWLNHWGCSRSFGLGTRLPFDDKYLIESLSDSTIYMAYYTISHLLQGNVQGSQVGHLGITPDQLNREFWDYIFLNCQYNQQIKVNEDKCIQIRNSFQYWYPLDLRASAKDLVKNHLTMSLFNHAAIWDQQPHMWPRSYFVNGYMLVDGKKMSKQNGNFYTLKDIVDKYGADATRFALAESGDSQDDANFEIKIADNSILKISTLEMWIKEYVKNVSDARDYNDQVCNEKVVFFDKVFTNQIKQLTIQCIKSYEELKFRDVTKYGFHEFGSIKDEYLINCEKLGGPRKDILLEWIKYQLLLIYPIAPHFAEIAWQNQFWLLLSKEQQEKIKKNINENTLPKISEFIIDEVVLRSYNCLQNFLRNVRLTYAKQTQIKKGNKEIVFNKAIVIYTVKYNDWQQKVLEQLRNSLQGDVLNIDWKNKIRDSLDISVDIKKKSLQFAAFIQKEFETSGKEAIESILPFNELQLLQDNKENILKEVKLENIEFLCADDAEKSQEKVFLTAVQNCMPGKAQIIFI
ncbi:leucyl-tRNA synthetase, putative [Ichthyophthirius multifiliis]|uniref:leucine--tRNA ligase n=1 Tax=Ichthyophthirius multifiliis TaxID=5932 RepID=G0R6E9_ICHMU|nr:leucyl-tRNA synthetase, putative [Ichthyophthirius multifiliis]EGR26946.1 leucyl-tRNA synthetase, putative [Ichthyophthirius multifiliis]|eukprot:XP_004023830.1 leucyl-tRNA synthetase, putative [Ichthyophthirius multifiliis]